MSSSFLLLYRQYKKDNISKPLEYEGPQKRIKLKSTQQQHQTSSKFMSLQSHEVEERMRKFEEKNNLVSHSDTYQYSNIIFFVFMKSFFVNFFLFF